MSPPNNVIIETQFFDDFNYNSDIQGTEDLIENQVESFASMPGQDDIVFDSRGEWAYVTTLEGTIWRVNLKTGDASFFIDPPLMPAGARLSPVDSNIIYFCASRYYQVNYPADEKVGLYQLDLKNKQIKTILTEVPNQSWMNIIPKKETVYPISQQQHYSSHAASENPQRPLEFCNDLDISADGQRIYFSEPFSYEGASMGGGAFYEAVSLGRNGKLWMFDLNKQSIALVAHGYNFIDGVLLEYPPVQDGLSTDNRREASILISETTRFSIHRLSLSDGLSHKLWSSLPYMPDGFDQDDNGNIWVGMIKKRSNFMNWLHKHSWAKEIVMRLPRNWIPVKKNSAIMAFSKDMTEILFYSEHSGQLVSDISVVVPYEGYLYLPSFALEQKSLHRLKIPHIKSF